MMIAAKRVQIGLSMALCLANSAWAFNSKSREACTVSTGSLSPVRTICDVSSSLSQGAYGATVTLPNGKKFQIEGDFEKPDGWTVNGDSAVIVNPRDMSRPCYRTAKLEICLGQ
jgi:hypothetical protein